MVNATASALTMVGEELTVCPPTPRPRTFGHVPGFAEGATFPSRGALSGSGVHVPLRAGISGRQGGGADSILLTAGAYEDDGDFGDEVIYTGHGKLTFRRKSPPRAPGSRAGAARR